MCAIVIRYILAHVIVWNFISCNINSINVKWMWNCMRVCVCVCVRLQKGGSKYIIWYTNTLYSEYGVVKHILNLSHIILCYTIDISLRLDVWRTLVKGAFTHILARNSLYIVALGSWNKQLSHFMMNQKVNHTFNMHQLSLCTGCNYMYL